MTESNPDILSFYGQHSPITDPGEHIGLYDNLPADLAVLCEIVQTNLLHIFWAERYGVELFDERKTEPGIRHVARKLARLQEIKPVPLSQERSLQEKLVGNCRDFTVVLTSLLRHQGVPARARCGFGAYFQPDWYEDHWVCEYWNEAENRWILVDAQLDAFQCQALKITFDPLDVPRDQFVVGGKAWQLCRGGEANPDNFGIFDMHGLWFVRGNHVRDFAALNKLPLLPWDGWGLIDLQDEEITPEGWNLLDQAADLTAEQVDFAAVRQLFQAEEGLRVPTIISSYTPSGPLKVDWVTEAVIDR